MLDAKVYVLQPGYMHMLGGLACSLPISSWRNYLNRNIQAYAGKWSQIRFHVFVGSQLPNVAIRSLFGRVLQWLLCMHANVQNGFRLSSHIDG